MTRILLVDDHAVVRQGLKKILSEDLAAVVFGEAENGRQALDLAARERWDLVVLDLWMPVKCGLEVLKELKRQRPAPPVIVLSMHLEGFYALRALKAGAAGYLTKQSAPEELARAVRKVLAGGRYITAAMAEQLAAALDSDVTRPPHEALSDREVQVLRLITSGKTLKEIAADLSLSPKTVSTHRARVLEKMHMKTSAELTAYAIRNGLLSAEP